jgi:hypothetical protein
MEIYVSVPLEERIARGVHAFMTESSAKQVQATWLADRELTEEKRSEEASDWGAGISIWECGLKPGIVV